jgi:hypothetical protein
MSNYASDGVDNPNAGARMNNATRSRGEVEEAGCRRAYPEVTATQQTTPDGADDGLIETEVTVMNRYAFRRRRTSRNSLMTRTILTKRSHYREEWR